MNKCSYPNCLYKAGIHKDYRSHIYCHVRNNEPLKCPYFKSYHKETLFNNINSLKSHFFPEHNASEFGEQSFSSINLEQIDHNFVENHELDKSVETEKCKDLSEKISYKKNSLQLFAELYVKLKAKHVVSEKALQIFIDSYRDLNSLNTKYLSSKVAEKDRESLRQLLSENLFSKIHNKKNRAVKEYLQ